MSETLYVKYNSTRMPEYQAATRFVQEDGMLFVEKYAPSRRAAAHVLQIETNARLLQNYYTNIRVLPCSIVNGAVRSRFLKDAASLSSVIDCSADLSTIREQIVCLLDTIFEIRTSYKTDFELTEDFREFFLYGGDDETRLETCRRILGGRPAFTVANLDPMFSNFMKDGEVLYCIDCEWVVSFPVPADFLKYRVLRYLYNDKRVSLEGRISVNGFLHLFQFSSEEQELFGFLDDRFQDRIHGTARKYLYPARCEKPSVSFDSITARAQELEVQNAKLEKTCTDQAEALKAQLERSEQLEETIRSLNEYGHELQKIIRFQEQKLDTVRRGIKNPLFGAAEVSRYVSRKLKNKLLPLRQYALPDLEAENARGSDAEGQSTVEAVFGDVLMDYETWITRKEEREQAMIPDPSGSHLAFRPLISVLVPVYNVLDRHLVPCIESVLNQTYQNLELCLADDCSTWQNVRETLKKYENDPRVKIVYRRENGHISECTNSALSMATGDFVGLLDCDDLLSPYALYEMAAKLNENPELDFIYSDEDKIDDEGKHRHYPNFKPDWSPDTLMSNMYTCHFTIYRTSLVRQAGGLRSEFNGSQDYDLALRIADMTTPDRIAHIDKILYHWRTRPESTSGDAGVKPYVFEAARKAKMASLARRGLCGTTALVDVMNQYNVVYEPAGMPLVSILIPSRDHPDLARQCIVSIFEKTDYRNFEIILIDNGSSPENRSAYEAFCHDYGVNYVYEPMEFNFSRMNNLAASRSQGDYLALLNDDIEITNSRWLGTMLGQAMLPYAGAVGCKLLYPQNRLIQHVGVVNLERGPVHMFAGLPDEPIYPFGRNRLHYNVLAVTAACLVVKKSRYYEVGGLDESYAVSYNDVDFCMKLYEAGYYNVVRNDVTLYHHESVSRGSDLTDRGKMRRLMQEEDRLYKSHPQFAHRDPFYNRHYTQTANDFSLDFENFAEHVSPVSLCESPLPPVKEFYGHIDRISSERYIEIEGWCLLREYQNNSSLPRRICLKGKDRIWQIKAYPVDRKDVEDQFSFMKNITRCGFRCRFPENRIGYENYEIFVVTPKGSWRTGVHLEK